MGSDEVMRVEPPMNGVRGLPALLPLEDAIHGVAKSRTRLSD